MLHNVNSFFDKLFSQTPERIALTFQKGHGKFEHFSYRDIFGLKETFLLHLRALRLEEGDKIVVLVKPSSQFVAMILALKQLHLIPVFIDPGMGPKNLAQLVKHVGAQAIIAPFLLRPFSVFIFHIFPSLNCLYFYNSPLKNKVIFKAQKRVVDERDKELIREDIFGIFFTSGSTGLPKGALWSNANIFAMIGSIDEVGQERKNNKELILFGLFLLTAFLKGRHCIIPRISFLKLSKARPSLILDCLDRFRPGYFFSSPVILKNLYRFLKRNELIFSRPILIATGGAPYYFSSYQQLKEVLPNAIVKRVYGATEGHSQLFSSV